MDQMETEVDAIEEGDWRYKSNGNREDRHMTDWNLQKLFGRLWFSKNHDARVRNRERRSVYIQWRVGMIYIACGLEGEESLFVDREFISGISSNIWFCHTILSKITKKKKKEKCMLKNWKVKQPLYFFVGDGGLWKTQTFIGVYPNNWSRKYSRLNTATNEYPGDHMKNTAQMIVKVWPLDIRNSLLGIGKHHGYHFFHISLMCCQSLIVFRNK